MAQEHLQTMLKTQMESMDSDESEESLEIVPPQTRPVFTQAVVQTEKALLADASVETTRAAFASLATQTAVKQTRDVGTGVMTPPKAL